MASFIDLPLANYPNGTRSTAWRALDPTITQISVEVARCTSVDPTIWPNDTTLLDLNIDLSMDGGATVFTSAGTGQAKGGIVSRNGVEADATRVTLIGIPPGANRAVRLSATITGGPLRTSGTISAS